MLTLSGSNGQRIKFALASFQSGPDTYRTKAKAKQIKETRMHSSRMRTGRSLTVYRSLLPEGGGCLLGGCLLRVGVSAPGGGCLLRVGGVCSGWGVSAPRGGVCSGWVSASRGGVCSRGVCFGGGERGIPACTEADPRC